MASVVCEVIKHMMYKIDIANIYLGIRLHYLLVLAAVLIFGYAFNWVNQLLVYVLAGMCGVVLILCCYLDISRVKADIDEIKKKLEIAQRNNMPNKDLMVGSLEYLIGLQYSYLNDKKNMMKYFKPALIHCKGTTYEVEMNQVIEKMNENI